MSRNTLIQVRRGTSLQWSEANGGLSAVLGAGEWGLDTTLNRYKIGDGSTVWNNLPWASIKPTDQDIVGASGIGITYNSTTSSDIPLITVAITGIPSSQINNFTTSVQSVIGSSLLEGSGISIDHNDGQTTISLSDPTIELANITDLSVDASSFLLTPSSATLKTLVGDVTGSGSLVFNTNSSLTNTSLSGSTLVEGVLTVNQISGNGNPLDITGGGDDVSISTGASGGKLTLGGSQEEIDLVGTIKLNGTTLSSTANSLNLLNGASANTVVNSKAVIYGPSGQIAASSLNTTGNVTVGGDLIVSGTTTTVNSTTVNIGDNVIRINTSGLNTGGFEVFKGGDASVSTNYESLIWNTADNSWLFSGPKVSTTGDIVANKFIGNGSELTNLSAANIVGSGQLDANVLPSLQLIAPTGSDVASTFLTGVSTDGRGRLTSYTIGTHTLASTTVKGIASFNSASFDVVNGEVSVKTSGISNTQLVNNKLTIGATSLELGSTTVALSGLSSNNPVVLTYFAIDGGTP